MFCTVLATALATIYVTKYPSTADGSVSMVNVSTNESVESAQLDATDGTTWKFKYWDIPNAMDITPDTVSHNVKVSTSVGAVRHVRGVFSNYEEATTNQPSVFGSSIYLIATRNPEQGGSVSPQEKRWYGFYPMSVTQEVVATRSNGWKFERWTRNGVKVSDSNVVTFAESLPKGISRSTTTVAYEAQFSKIPIDVTVYLDGDNLGTKTSYYTDEKSQAFVIDKVTPVNHTFAYISGSDDIGGTYTLNNSHYDDFTVNLRPSSWYPPLPKGYVNCRLVSHFTPNYPWRDDDDDGDGDSGSTPNLNNPLGWVWVHARPIPSSGSKGTVSPTDWAINGYQYSWKTFTFVATPASSSYEFVDWEDEDGNVLSRNATYSPKYQILHAAVSSGQDSQGYEKTIYARFQDKPPQRRKVKIRYMTEKYLPDTGVDVCGLGGIEVEGSASFNTTSSIGSFIEKEVFVEYTETYDEETGEYTYTFAEDPVTIPVAIATPSNGFFSVWWNGGLSDSDWTVRTTNNTLSVTIPAQEILDYGWPESEDLTYKDPYKIYGVVFVPRLGIKLNKGYLDRLSNAGYTYYSDPSFSDNETKYIDADDGIMKLYVEASRVSGSNEVQYLYYTVYDSYETGSISVRAYNQCKGTSTTMGVTMTNAVYSLPEGDHRTPWYFQYQPMFSLKAETGRPLYDVNSKIIHDDNGNVLGDFSASQPETE